MTFKRAARIDGNQPEIVAKFRQLGFSVLHTHQLKNCVDIFVSRDKLTASVEIKDGSLPPSARKLSEGEIKFREDWKGMYFLCESIDDVLKIERVFTALSNAAGLIIKEHLK